MAWQYHELTIEPSGNYYFLSDEIKGKTAFDVKYDPHCKANQELNPTLEFPFPFCAVMPFFEMNFPDYRLRLDKEGLGRKITKITSQKASGSVIIGKRKKDFSKVSFGVEKHVGDGNYDDFQAMIIYALERFPAIPDEVIANTKILPVKEYPMTAQETLAVTQPIDKINWTQVYYSIVTSFRYHINQAIAASFDKRDLRMLNPNQARTLAELVKQFKTL